ncbi:hypothetical protein FOCC_FOCC001527 [Frankliniella occidentalis]|nr:hypothetical protein FOCC_FOCC001527 [Frankliniella occidentalis]
MRNQIRKSPLSKRKPEFKFNFTSSVFNAWFDNMKEYLITTIMRIFEVGPEQAECLYQELIACTRNKHLITVFRMSDRQEAVQELDQTILTALFKSQHLSPSEQLQLALTWNRVDIARSEIFVYGQEWPPGALEEAMMQALEHDRLDFVKLLLENGVSMRKFLTIPRLEELYNSKNGPSNTLGYILRDVRPHIPRGYVYTLHDIGLVINKLMGGAYRAHYTRRKFRMIYTKVMKKSPHVQRNSSSFIRYVGNQNATLSLLAETLPSSPDMPYFDHPFNELLTWAVLTKRQQMALLMWQHGEEALAKALVAAKLYKAMAHEAAEDDLEAEIYEELRSYGKEFENIALELLDYCYRQDDDQTQKLLTCELQNWSGQTCLSLAVSANHRALLAHPCSQIILADLWMGGLRTRKNTNLKVILGLLCPAYIPQLEFKSREELQLMPQTEEEHQLGLEEDEEESMEGGAGGGGGSRPGPKKPISRLLSMRAKQALEMQAASTNNNPKAKAKKKVLIMDPGPRESVVNENGKVTLDDGTTNPLLQFPYDFYDIKKEERPLKLRKKLYEFYTAPISKFWGHSIAYMVFLYTFSYVVLVRMPSMPSWPELYVIGYITAFGFEKIRELLSAEPAQAGGVGVEHVEPVRHRGGAVLPVGAGAAPPERPHVHREAAILRPLVTMMDKMVKNMIYFVVLLLVVLVSFGVCRQAILFPDNEASWDLVKDIFFQPYFMLYGEVFADAIDPPCGGKDMPPCQTGRWVSPVVMSLYLLVANILLINLLIARFTVVMEYEQKPVLPPPFIIFSHIYMLVKFLLRKARGQRSETYDNGLKLFLENDDLERLHDFAINERVDHISQKVEDVIQKENAHSTAYQNLELYLRKLEELSDQTVSHLGVIHRFMATQGRDVPTLQPPVSFATALRGSNQEVQQAGLQGSPGDRLRRFSERSEVEGQPSREARGASETSGSATELAAAGAALGPLGPSLGAPLGAPLGLALGPAFPRRRPVRSWTEVRSERPDNNVFEPPKQCVLVEEGEGHEDDDSFESDLDDLATMQAPPPLGTSSPYAGATSSMGTAGPTRPLRHRAGASSSADASPPEAWSPARCTVSSPTDAYGTVEFQGGPHSLKAQYVRLAHDTRPDQILQLFTREWSLELPKLLITVLRKGLLRAAKTTGAWIFTSGTNTGVTRQVGDALVSERTQRGPGRVVSIGIAPWGIVEGNRELVARGREVPYHAIASPRSRMAVLNNRHAYFLMVDNGTTARYGAEVMLRRKLEKYISMQKLNPSTHCSTPVVCLVIEGGTNTIRAVLEYVTDSPPVPVVVCDGSGRAADLIAFTHK